VVAHRARRGGGAQLAAVVRWSSIAVVVRWSSIAVVVAVPALVTELVVVAVVVALVVVVAELVVVAVVAVVVLEARRWWRTELAAVVIRCRRSPSRAAPLRGGRVLDILSATSRSFVVAA
jgi:hypothetical protein